MYVLLHILNSLQNACVTMYIFYSFQFMLRSEVLKLYRDILRTVRKIPDDHYREEMKIWAQQDFKKNMHLTDEV